MWILATGEAGEQVFVPLADMPAAWLVAVGVLVVAIAGRRWLPLAVSEALFAGGLSGGLLFSYVTAGEPVDVALRLCAVLSALAMLWHIAVRWVERQRDDSGPDSSVRQLIGAHAVALCGLSVAGIALGMPADVPTRIRLALTLCLTILLVPALLRHRYGDGPLCRYAAVGLLGCGLWLWFPRAATAARQDAISVAAMLAAAAALLVGLWPILRHWRHRRRVWQTEPERLIDPPVKMRGPAIVVAVLGGGAGIAAVLIPTALLAPVAVGLVAIAVLSAAHWRGSVALGEFGLALVGEMVVLMIVAWLPTLRLGALTGCALAGVYLLWLSRFWQQQLRDGVPWTTAGRLILVTRQLGYAAAAASVVLAVRSTTVGAASGWHELVPALLLMLLFSMLVRTAAIGNCQPAALAACLSVTAASVPARAALAAAGVAVSWPALAGCACLLLALRVGAQRGRRATDVVYNAYIGGFLPVVALLGATIPGAYGASWIDKLVAAGAMLLGLGLRWRAGLHSAGTGTEQDTSAAD